MTTTMEPTVTEDVQTPEPWVYNLSAGEYAATVEKIAKINARAAKRGFTGRLVVTGERVEVTRKDQFTGLNITEVVYKTTLTGTAPSYNGWKFLARIDRVGDSFTIATAPGVDHVERSLVHPGECDHCGHDRTRNNTYLVQNEETGAVANVGSTCIKDFLGWSASVVFFTEKDVTDEFDSLGFGSGHYERSFSVETILALGHAATRAFGWVSKSAAEYGERTATVSYVWLALEPPRKLTDEQKRNLETLRAYADEATERAATVRAFVLSDDFSGTSTYVDNLKVSAAQDFVTYKQVGLLASAPQAYSRFLETAAERAAKEALWAAEKAAKQSSEYLAEVGAKKVRVEGTITGIRYIQGDYGTTVLYTITTKDGNVAKWFASREALGEEQGREVVITGTVKKHEEYQGTKATVLTRCKEVE